MLDALIGLDKDLLLMLNGIHCEVADTLMWYVSKTWAWIPFEALLLWMLHKRLGDWRLTLCALVGVALVVLCADRFASGLCKTLFCRPRPSHDPELAALVHVVREYRGGPYGFISSHAANTFGVAMYLSFFFSRPMRAVLFSWAVLCSYSRIYLGVHYPGDILCGAVAGIIIACLLHLVYKHLIINDKL